MASAILDVALPIETVAEAMSERHLVEYAKATNVIKMRVLMVSNFK